jgi:hypothetical protein
MLIAWVAVVLAFGGGCHGRERRRWRSLEELALLTPPLGITPADQRVGLGEMYAEGGRRIAWATRRPGK